MTSAEKTLFQGWSWFNFTNLGLVLDMALTFYASLAEALKLNVRKFWALIPTFEKIVWKGKLVGREGEWLFTPPIHNKVKNATENGTITQAYWSKH